jgi:hypothetical protein
MNVSDRARSLEQLKMAHKLAIWFHRSFGRAEEVDSQRLTFECGTQPQAGRNLAISEWPPQDGRADYVLFTGLEAVAVVEAKRYSKDVAGAMQIDLFKLPDELNFDVESFNRQILTEGFNSESARGSFRF